MGFIELDHTSSGVQIAAALAKHAEMAATVNMVKADEKSDLYTLVANDTNAAFKQLGVDIALGRDDVKAAVIAKIYGGTHHNDKQELAGVVPFSQDDEPEAFKAFTDAMNAKMAGVVNVQAYFAYIAKKLDAAGITCFDLLLADGSYVTVKAVNKKPKFVTEKAQVYDCAKATSESFGMKVEVVAIYKAMPAKSMVAKYIQSFDAFLLAQVKVALVEAGIPVYAKHDAYLVPDAFRNEVVAIAQQVMYETFKVDHLAALTADLNEKYDLDLDSFESKYGYGSYDPEQILSANFLIA